MSIREIKRQSNYYYVGAPFNIESIDAEIVVEDNGMTVYLIGQWSSEAEDISFCATKESLFEVLKASQEFSEETGILDEKMNNILSSKEDDKVVSERYGVFLDELTQIINEVKREHEKEE